MRYFVKSGSKIDCLMGVAKEKTQINLLYYLWLTLLGYSTFAEKEK